jgi:hypothetical protein
VSLAAALRPWATSPAVNRELRAMLGATPGTGPRAFVVLLPGAFAPESIPAWRTVEGRRVAVVGLELARDIATGRSDTAPAELASPPPAGCAWCIALAADGRALTWPTPLVFNGSAPSISDASNAPGGDA